MEKLPAKIVQYRNGIYQGFLKGGKRNGLGILITDSGQIFLGNWKNDLLYGEAFVQLTYQEYGFGDFNRGQIQGHFIFRKKGKSLFGEFNSSRPINSLLLIDYQTSKSQLLGFKSPIYQIEREFKTQNMSETLIIEQIGKAKVYTPELISYLETKFGNTNFQIQSLPNSNFIFAWNDPVNPLSLGFTLNKLGNLISFGVYENYKLNGIGCKYENNIRYQGIFKNGFINGMGLKYSKGKYSFGSFEEGNLLEAVHLEERSDISEQKLVELKRLEHIKSMNFMNSYIRNNLLRFRGFSEIVFESEAYQQYLYPKDQIKSTTSKNIAIQLINQREYQTKSTKSHLKNPQDQDRISENKYERITPLSGFKKFNLN